MVEVVFLDIDGVLTDGTVWVDAAGNETKRIAFDDIDAVFELKRAGIKVGFITGEDNQFCQYIRRRFEPDFFLAGCKDKVVAFQQLARKTSLDPANACFVGDSRKDIGLLRFVPASFVPGDVDPIVRRAAKTVLRAYRGQGVVREVVDRLLGKGQGEGHQKRTASRHVGKRKAVRMRQPEG